MELGNFCFVFSIFYCRKVYKLDLLFFRSYFFSVDFVRNLFLRNNYREVETVYVSRRTVNKKEGIDVPRVFVQAKYKK